MSDSKKIIAAMKSAAKPVSAGEIAELSGLDRKVVDKEMKKLKDSGEIISPKRCYWEPK